MAARHMAGQIPAEWLTDQAETEAPSYRGRHFKVAPVADPVIPEPPTLQVDVSPDFDADEEARLIVEQIMRELDIAPSSSAAPAPAPQAPAPQAPAASPSPMDVRVPEVEAAVAVPTAVPGLDAFGMDEFDLDEPEPIALREHAVLSVPEVAPAGEDVLPIPHVAEAEPASAQTNAVAEDAEELDELDSTLRLDRDALHRSLDEQEDELDATLALDRDTVREAVRGSSVPRERLSVQEALSASDIQEQEAQREQYGAAARNLALDHELGDSTLRRIEAEEQRRPLSFFARIGAAVSKALHLDRR